MKAALLALTVLASISTLSQRAVAGSPSEESHYISAIAIYLDGSVNQFFRVEENGPNANLAGNCILENPKAESGWDIVDESVCDAQIKANDGK